MDVGERAIEVSDQLGQLPWEVVLAVHGAATAQRCRRQTVAAWRAAKAEIDATGMQRLEHAELLGHHERRMVGQHDAARAQSQRGRACGQVRDQHRR